MTTFDQRGQNVTYQYNAAGNINFNNADTKAKVTDELEKLKEEFDRAFALGLFDEATATNLEYQIKKAILEATKETPTKNTIVEHLNKAKDLIIEIAAAAGLVKALTEAINVVKEIF